MPESRRPPFGAAYCAAALGLLGFGLAHAAFITPLVDRAEAPLGLVILAMIGAPILFGAPLTAVATLGVAFYWRRARAARPVLAGWQFGVALMLPFLPAFMLSFFVGGSDEAPPGAPVFMLAGQALVAASAAAWLAGPRAIGWALLATLPPAFFNGMFVASTHPSPWVAAFVVATYGVIIGSGEALSRIEAALARRRDRSTPDEAPS